MSAGRNKDLSALSRFLLGFLRVVCWVMRSGVIGENSVLCPWGLRSLPALIGPGAALIRWALPVTVYIMPPVLACGFPLIFAGRK